MEFIIWEIPKKKQPHIYIIEDFENFHSLFQKIKCFRRSTYLPEIASGRTLPSLNVSIDKARGSKSFAAARFMPVSNQKVSNGLYFLKIFLSTFGAKIIKFHCESFHDNLRIFQFKLKIREFSALTSIYF